MQIYSSNLRFQDIKLAKGIYQVILKHYSTLLKITKNSEQTFDKR